MRSLARAAVVIADDVIDLAAIGGFLFALYVGALIVTRAI